MGHVVLLGDSIFDNAAYVGGGPDVQAHLRRLLPPDWRATLLARDGAVTAGVAQQVRHLPPGPSHLVVSVGGNDALGASGILGEGARSVADVVGRLAAIQAGFAASYAEMLDFVLARRLPTALCTIYDANYPDPVYQRLVRTGLALFNDAITRAAFDRGLPVLDLRLICREPGDYANPIEPSVQGGGKIAAAIAGLLRDGHWSNPHSIVVTR